MLTKSANFQRAGDPWKYNCENTGFVISSKLTCLKNLHVYGRWMYITVSRVYCSTCMQTMTCKLATTAREQLNSTDPTNMSFSYPVFCQYYRC